MIFQDEDSLKGSQSGDQAAKSSSKHERQE